MLRKSNQKGFTMVEGLLVTIIIVMVAFVGYYVWHTQKTTNNTLNSASKIAESSSTEASPIYKLDNIGVQFKLPSSLSDLQYTPNDTTDTSGGYLSVASMESIFKNCNTDNLSPSDSITPSDYSFAGITKEPGKFDASTAVEETLLKQFDTFSITISYPNGPQCVTNDQNIMSQWTTVKKAATDAFVKAFQASATEIKQ